MENCLFCQIASGKIPANLVFENKHLLAFRDINPQAPVHVVIIPKRHVASVMELNPQDAAWWAELPSIVQGIAKKEKVDKNGFRLVVNCGENGGQTVFHLHIHLIAGRAMQWPPG